MSYDIPTGGRVLIDTNIFIFSIMRQLEQDADLSPREAYSRQQAVLAKAFLRRCNNLRTEVCMSYISVCEVLEGIPEAFSEETFRLMESTFTLLSFGGTPALLAADFARKLRKLDDVARPDRSKLRNDLLILASAIQVGCTTCYTSDALMIKQASRLDIPIVVQPLPDINASQS